MEKSLYNIFQQSSPRSYPKWEVLHVLPFSTDISLKQARSGAEFCPAVWTRAYGTGWGVTGSFPALKHFHHTVTLTESLNIFPLRFHGEVRDEQRWHV